MKERGFLESMVKYRKHSSILVMRHYAFQLKDKRRKHECSLFLGNKILEMQNVINQFNTSGRENKSIYEIGSNLINGFRTNIQKVNIFGKD